MSSDELTYGANVDLAFEVQSDFAETREPQFEFSVEIEPTGGPYSKIQAWSIEQR